MKKFAGLSMAIWNVFSALNENGIQAISFRGRTPCFRSMWRTEDQCRIHDVAPRAAERRRMGRGFLFLVLQAWSYPFHQCHVQLQLEWNNETKGFCSWCFRHGLIRFINVM